MSESQITPAGPRENINIFVSFWTRKTILPLTAKMKSQRNRATYGTSVDTARK